MNRHASVNRIYRLVWSHASNSWVPAAETSRGRKKGSSKTLLAAALTLAAGLAEAAPLGGQVVSGSGHIGQAGTLTTITQTSSVLSLSWASFNITPQETVDFVQPSASAIAVNRITGSNGTQILGHLDSNGQVYLINPNGIVFGRGAQVDVGGLVASALDLNDASLAGDARAFSGTGSGTVSNKGTINATGNGSGGGYVALLGNHVVNQGTISAQLGTVALGAGSAATLTFQGDSLVHLQVDRSVLNSVATNGGLIRADGGQVLMSAGAANALLASVVNNTGVIEARTVQEHDGTIALLGGTAAGTVNVAGTLDASAPTGGNGGFIETSAAHVEVANSAKVTTAAAHGLTGSWLIDPQDYVVAASGGDITGAELSANLATSDIRLDSSAGTAAGSGNVNVNDPVSWSANTTLTLEASNNVNVNASLTATGNTAGVVIRANTVNGNETASGPGILTLNNGASINLPGTNPSLSIAGATFVVINSLGSAGNTTGTDLQGANGNLAAHYALGSNIDASATAQWNGGAGFMPIGSSASPFTGTFDGLGHTISNLSINRYMDYVGLFGEVGSTGIVRNTGMLGGSVHGGGYYDGILVGRNLGSVSNSYTTGSLTGTSNSIGGLVGGNNGTVSNSYSTATIGGANNTGGLAGINYGSISNSYATGAVAGGYDVGGLLGFNRTGTATDVYSTGGVNGIANIGGLAGQNNGTVSNSYATGNAHGSGATIAGLVGNNYGTISDSYATGRVTGSSSLSGLAGHGGTVTNSFWDVSTSGLATSVRGTGLTTSQMRTAADFTGFVFATTPGATGNSWVMVDVDGGLNNQSGSLGATFPMLTSEYSTVIVNAHQLQLMALAPGASYTLAANIDAAATALGGAIGGDVWSTAGGFFPIGTGGMGAFGGSFDGLGHTISNLTMTWPADLAYVGLFGNAAPGSIIKNVGLIGASVTQTGVSVFSQPANGTGALVGTNQGTISNSYATGVVSGTSQVGGLAGNNYGSIANAYATGNVTGNINVGGLVGASSGSITNAYATGNVTGNSYAGGLVGKNYGSVSKSYANGSISGSNVLGGLIGINHGSVNNSFWNSDVMAIGVASDAGGSGAFSGGGGLTGGQMRAMSNFAGAGWSISNTGGGDVWQIYEGSTAPLLSSFLTPLTVTASNASTVFNGAGFSGNGVTYSATPNGNLLGILSYGAAQGAVGAGSYAITPTGLYSTQQGYSINVASATLTISPLTLTGTVAAGNSVYGAPFTPGAVTFSNLVTGYTAVTSPITISTAGNLSGGGQLKVGTYSGVESAGSALTGADAGNYTFAGAFNNYTVTPRALSGAIAEGNSVYGAPLTPGSTNFSNAIVGDTVTAGTVTISTTNHTSTSGNFTAGTHTGSESVGSMLTGADSSNYSFAGATGSYTVTPLTVTAAAAGVNKVYDGTTSEAPSLSVGVLSGDQVTWAAGGATFASKNVGTAQAITVSGISIGGADAADYVLSSTTAMATASISPASLTLSGVAASNKAYDGTTMATLTGGSLVGVVAGDASSVTLTEAGNFASKNAGTGIAVAASLSGVGAGNYVLVQPTGLTANITPATLTYDANPAARTAGQSLTGFTGSLRGFVGNETQATDTSGTLAWTTPANAGSGAGQYAIDGGGLTAANYVFVEAPGNAAALTLQPATAPPAPPMVPNIPLPRGALSAIASLQAAMLPSPAALPEALDQSVTLIAAQSTDGTSPGESGGGAASDVIASSGNSNGSWWGEVPVADTTRMSGATGGFSLRIVGGGVRLPQ